MARHHLLRTRLWCTQFKCILSNKYKFSCIIQFKVSDFFLTFTFFGFIGIVRWCASKVFRLAAQGAGPRLVKDSCHWGIPMCTNIILELERLYIVCSLYPLVFYIQKYFKFFNRLCHKDDKDCFLSWLRPFNEQILCLF